MIKDNLTPTHKWLLLMCTTRHLNYHSYTHSSSEKTFNYHIWVHTHNELDWTWEREIWHVNYNRTHRWHRNTPQRASQNLTCNTHTNDRSAFHLETHTLLNSPNGKRPKVSVPVLTVGYWFQHVWLTSHRDWTIILFSLDRLQSL